MTTAARDIELTVDGEARRVHVYAPAKALAASKRSLVVAFHGRGINGEKMARLCGMNEDAEREGFIVAFPDGRVDPQGGRYWLMHYTPQAVVNGSEELDFVGELLDALIGEYGVDPERVYGVGFSNGGILCYALARWMTQRFRAIGAVGGIADYGQFELEAPLSICHIHGTRDRFIPYFGGRTARKDVPIIFPPVIDMLHPWLEATGCLHLRQIDKLTDPEDKTLVTRIEDYGPGWSGSEVRVVTVEGGGHTWPGRTPLGSSFGKWTKAFSAGELLWRFFARSQGEAR